MKIIAIVTVNGREAWTADSSSGAASFNGFAKTL